MLNEIVSSQSLSKLEIVGYDNPDCTGTKHSVFKAQINPETISITHKINYSKKKQVDNKPTANAVSDEEAQELSFSLILDDTGVLNPIGGAMVSMASSLMNAAAGGGKCFVDQQIEDLKKTCYYYLGTKHEHTYCKITWGKDLLQYKNTSFGGRLKTMNIAYTLFSPSGLPLRAKVDLCFIVTWDEETMVKLADNQSPDLTHVITIKTGENLPMLCQKIYGNASLYSEIARINNIVNFRYLKPGTEVTFPPMK